MYVYATTVVWVGIAFELAKEVVSRDDGRIDMLKVCRGPSSDQQSCTIKIISLTMGTITIISRLCKLRNNMHTMSQPRQAGNTTSDLIGSYPYRMEGIYPMQHRCRYEHT